MVQENLVTFIKDNVNRGYRINDIRTNLIRQGYHPAIVDEAIRYAYTPEIKHTIHLSPTALLAIALIILGLGGLTAGIIYLVQKDETPKNLLDITIKVTEIQAYPGDIFHFNVELFNLGNLNRYDVNLKYDITDKRAGSVLTSKTETVAIETGKSLTAEIVIPDNAHVGDYELKARAMYKEKTADSSIMIRIVKKEPDPTCTDGIRNQGEENIDCGGPCPPCPTCSDDVQNQGETGIDCGGPCSSCLDCNDNNICTIDTIIDDRCHYEKIVPCCGNDRCEDGEDRSSCPLDCTTSEMFDDLTIWEKLELIKDLARTDSREAERLCQEIQEALYKEQCLENVAAESGTKKICESITDNILISKCYLDVAKKTQDSSVCAEIPSPNRKDSCYMNFVLDNQEYDLCDKIENQYQRDSCILLKGYQQT